MYLVEVTCSALESILNGGVSYDRDSSDGQYPFNTTASFSCNSEYLLSGSDSRTCQTSGDWSQQTPVCRGNIMKISVNCFLKRKIYLNKFLKKLKYFIFIYSYIYIYIFNDKE